MAVAMSPASWAARGPATTRMQNTRANLIVKLTSRRRRWFQGRPLHGTDAVDIGWFTERQLDPPTGFDDLLENLPWKRLL